MASYQPLSTLQYLSKVQSQAKPMPTNPTIPGIMQNLASKTPTASNVSLPTGQYTPAPTVSAQNFKPTAIGVKTSTPQDNIKTPTNTTPQPQVQKPVSSTSSTENGTQNTNAGNFTTPSGAVVNATTVTPPPQNQQQTSPAPTGYQANDTGLYGKLIAGVANTPSQYAPLIQAQQDRVNAINAQAEEAKKQFAQQTSDINQSGTWTSRALGEQGQANIQNSNVLNALSTQAGQAQGLIGNLLSQQSAQQSALQGAASGSAPQFQSYYNAQFNPVTGQYGTVGGGQYGSGPQAGANAQTEADYTKKYNDNSSVLKGADAIQNQIGQTIASNPDINNQPISFLTNLNQLVSGQLGSAPQQLLAQQVSNYVKQLGIDPASLVSLATQQKGTLAQLLESLRTTFQTTQIDPYNPTTFKNGLNASANDPLGIR